MEDIKEVQQMVLDFMHWFKWFVNPEMAQQYEASEKYHTKMTSDEFLIPIVDELRAKGRTEEEIEEYLEESGLLDYLTEENPEEQ